MITAVVGCELTRKNGAVYPAAIAAYRDQPEPSGSRCATQ
jgi:hypothetical protein